MFDQRFHTVRVKFGLGQNPEMLKSLINGPRFFVGTSAGQGVKNIGHGDNSGLYGDIPIPNSVGVSRAIQQLMMKMSNVP